MADEKTPSPTAQILETVVELRTAVLGAKDSADDGMAGALKRVGTQVNENAGAIQTLCALHQPGNEHMANGGISRKKKAGWIGGIGTMLAAIAYSIIQAFRNIPE